MSRDLPSSLLTDLSWSAIRNQLDRDRRLILPVGACDQYGPHLPLGAATHVAESLARDLADEFGVLRAPALPYGVNVPMQRAFAGTATLSAKALHRMLNDLLASWEDHGIDEFIVITVHAYDPHAEALATISGTRARVRVVETMRIDFGDLLEGPGGMQHGGEVLTSLMLYLCPDKVNMELARDYHPQEFRRIAARHIGSPPALPAEAPGSLGYPSLARAATGERIYQRMRERIRDRVLVDPPDDE